MILSHQFALIKRKGKWEQIENSKRKKTEDQIQTLANIMETLEDAVITKSLDGIITSWNKGAEQIYGYLAEEILGKSISILEPALLVEETKELVELIKQKDKIHHFETLRLRKDGKIKNVSLTLSPIFDNSENIITILVIARDITLRKKAVEELKKSEERYRIVTEQTGHVIYDYDLRTGKCIWAGAIEEVTGYSSEELQTFGKNFWVNNIHCEDTNLVSKKFLDVRTTEGRFKEELRLRRKDGTRIYIEHNGVSFTDHEGQFYGTIGIIKDITSIKIAGIQLQESENSFAEAQRISHIGNWDWNIITDEVYWSDETYRIFELGLQEFGATYNAFLSHVHQEDRDYFDDAIKKALNGESHSIDYRIILPNGKERDVHIKSKVISDENNIPIRMKGTVQDITERKKAEEALRLSNIYNRSLIEASLDPLVTIGYDGRITDVNISTEFVTGYSRDELVGTDFTNYFTDPNKAKKGYLEVFREGFVSDYSLEIRHKSGRTTSVLYNASVYIDGSGEVSGIFAAARDITKLKKTEEALKSKLEELAVSNAELEQFAYVSSHDLQEPLRMITSYLQLLQKRYYGNLDDKADKYINFAVDGASRMQNLINALLEFSRVSTRNRELEAMNCEFILNQALSNLKLMIKDNKATISQDPLPVVMSNSIQLSQLFQNLIINGIKFRREETPKIHISAEKTETEWVFSVQDKGIGMDPQYSGKIFEIFKRLHTREKYSEIGIDSQFVREL